MVIKYENLNDIEIIENYKRLKDLQRTKNKACYEKLKQNKVKYRYRLNHELEQQQKRMEILKQDEEAYKIYKEQKKYSNSLYYYNSLIKKHTVQDTLHEEVNNEHALTVYKP